MINIKRPEIPKAFESTLWKLDADGPKSPLDYVDDLSPNCVGSPLHHATLNGIDRAVCALIQEGAEVNATSTILSQTPLHWAMGLHQNKVATTLIEYGANMALYDKSLEGKAPIHIAAMTGNVIGIKIILSNGFPVDYLTERFGLTPLFFALKYKKVEIVISLIEYGADVNYIFENLDNATPLHLAVHNDNIISVEDLLQNGANTNIRCNHLTPCHIAAILGHLNCMKMIYCFNIEAIKSPVHDIYSQPPIIIIVAEYGHNEMLDWLLNLGISDDVQDLFGNSPLHGAAFYSQARTFCFLLEKSMFRGALPLTSDGKSIMHYAAAQSDYIIVKKLLDQGNDLNCEDKQGLTPLHCAVHYDLYYMFIYLITCGAQISVNPEVEIKNTLLYWAALGCSKETYHSLEYFGFHINQKDKSGDSYLHVLTAFGHEKSVEFVINFYPEFESNYYNEIDINITNASQWTPLHTAVFHDQTNIAEILLYKGADIMAYTDDGFTAVHFAAMAGNIRFLNLVENMGLDVSPRTDNDWGDLPIHKAASHGKVNVLEWYLMRGTHPDVQNTFGHTPLLIAVTTDSVECVQLLLYRGADVHFQSSENDVTTALHIACSYGFKDTVECLVGAGANCNATNGFLQTPLHISAMLGLHHMYSILVKAGADENLTDDLGRSPAEINSFQFHIVPNM